MSTARTTFGSLLRRFRAAAGYTQEELAERSGLSVRGISDLERGARQHPRQDTVELLAVALELGLEESATLITAARERGTGRTEPEARVIQPNLPQPLTTLIGRENDVAAVTRLLLRDDVRLVTLAGPGGVGKTRLALQAAVELRTHFRDGVLFVSLVTLRDPALVSGTIAHAVGLKEAHGEAPAARLHQFLNSKQALLVLDNFEHLVTVAPVVSDLLVACPLLKVVVASRNVLRLSAEHIYDVPPLSLPYQPDLEEVERFLRVPAVALFLDRRSALLPGWELTASDALAVSDICSRLDGLPLALELAAAHSRYCSLPELASRLSQRLTLLTGGPRDLPARHQTLRDTIAWSYGLLAPSAQRLFCWLSTFSGGWTLAMVEKLTAMWDGIEATSLLATLTDSSLVRVSQRVDAETRFDTLQTIREFAEERLTASGEDGAARDSHADVLLAFTDEAERGLQSGDRTVWSRRAADELDNVRAALGWSIDQGTVERALRMVGNLDWFWDAVGRDREGWGWTLEVLSQPGIDRDGWGYARALNAAGALAWNMGEFGRSADLLSESVARLRTLDDSRSLAQALANLGLTFFYQGDVDRARQVLRESVSIYEALDDPWGLAIAWFALGEVLVTRDLSDARGAYERSLTLFRAINEPWGIGHATSGLGGLAMRRRDFDTARTLMEEGLELRRAIGNPHAIATSLTSLGELARREGRLELAEEYLTEGLASFRDLGDSEHVAWALYNLGVAALGREELDSAAAALGECLKLRATQGNLEQIANTLAAIVGIAALGGNAEHAVLLSGAVETLRANSNAGARSNDDEVEEQELLARARLQLDENRSGEFFNTGRSLSLPEAIRRANDVLRNHQGTVRSR